MCIERVIAFKRPEYRSQSNDLPTIEVCLVRAIQDPSVQRPSAGIPVPGASVYVLQLHLITSRKNALSILRLFVL